MIKDIQNAFNEVLEDKIDIIENKSLELRFVIDSMNILEILLILEEQGYITKFIKVDEIITINDLIEKVKNEQD